MENLTLSQRNIVENGRPQGEQLKIYTYPNPILKKVAEPVTDFNDDLKLLCKNMLYTMYQAPGIGLAAPQVGISKRLFVLDIDFERSEVSRADGTKDFTIENPGPLIIINPIIHDKEGEILYQEGCLSVPGIYEDVKRSQTIQIDYQDWDGKKHSMEAIDLLSICLQHENDHLDGVVFLERLSLLKRQLLTKKFMKKKKKG
jgi:peptide deformylase